MAECIKEQRYLQSKTAINGVLKLEQFPSYHPCNILQVYMYKLLRRRYYLILNQCENPGT